MLAPSLPIETQRLRLRALRAEDGEALHEMESREDVTRWLYYEPRTAAESEEALARRVVRTRLAHEGDALELGIEHAGTGALLGTVILMYRSEQHRQGEIGFVLHPDHQGQGFAREAAREMLRLGFEQLGLHRIVGRLEPRNEASARLLERLGMRREAHLIENEWVKGEWQSELIYAMLDREWRAQA
ncbi:MAG TPA: GNAT family protein [Gaiellales bacterium]|nr:GNAT family protein [Gaiellales bacterium]